VSAIHSAQVGIDGFIRQATNKGPTRFPVLVYLSLGFVNSLTNTHSGSVDSAPSNP
jgi:hypothetical protein